MNKESERKAGEACMLCTEEPESSLVKKSQNRGVGLSLPMLMQALLDETSELTLSVLESASRPSHLTISCRASE